MNWYDNKEKTVSAKLPIVAIIALIACICSVFTLVETLYNSYYNMNVESACRIKAEFKANGNPKWGADWAKPGKGKMYFGWNQTKGSSTMKYTLKYKLSTESTYKVAKSNYSFSKNNHYYGGNWFITSTNGRAGVNFQELKVAGTNKESTLLTDFGQFTGSVQPPGR